jgi:release factor glutamine methyltransferase
LRAEPELALVSGPEGLDAIARLLIDAQRALAPGGAMVLELDPSQAETVARNAAKAVDGARISVLTDLAGLERFVLIERS